MTGRLTEFIGRTEVREGLTRNSLQVVRLGRFADRIDAPDEPGPAARPAWVRPARPAHFAYSAGLESGVLDAPEIQRPKQQL